MDATVHDIDSTRQSFNLASSSNVDDQQASLGSFVHGAQEDDGPTHIGNHYSKYMTVVGPWENKNWILLVILMLCYWLVWKNASVFYASEKRTCKNVFTYKGRWLSLRQPLQFKSTMHADN